MTRSPGRATTGAGYVRAVRAHLAAASELPLPDSAAALAAAGGVAARR